MIRALLALLLAAPAWADDGRQVFEQRCASCHSPLMGAPPGPGPNLAGLRGRRVAGDPPFDYSPALEAARATAPAWTPALLDQFLADPEAMFPGLWMGNNGVRAEADRSAIVAFLMGG